MATTVNAGDPLVGANWDGGTVPGPGDRVVIAHAMTLAGHLDIGTSPAKATGTPTTWDFEITSGGSLEITPAGRLTLRGYGLIRARIDAAAGLTINGTFEFDATLAADPANAGYDLYNGDEYYNYATFQTRKLVVGPGAVLRSVAGAANGAILGNLAGNLRVHGDWLGTADSPITVERLGRAGVPSVHFGGWDDVVQDTRLYYVVFKDCYPVKVHLRRDHQCDWQHVTLIDPVEAAVLNGGGYEITDIGAGVRQFVHCRFGGDVAFTDGDGREVDGGAGITFTDNVLQGELTANGGKFAAFDRNFYPVFGFKGTKFAELAEDNYILMPHGSENIHAFPVDSGTVRGCILDAPNDQTEGDPQSEGEFFPFNAFPVDVVVERCILIPQKSDGTNVAAFEWINDNPGRVTIRRNTIGMVSGSGLNLGHGGDNGLAGDRADVIDNLFVSFADLDGNANIATWIMAETWDAAVPPLRQANVHHNGHHRLHATRYNVPLAPGETLGAGDAEGDPFPDWPADPETRRRSLPRLESWGRQVLGLTGTGAAVQDAAIRAMVASEVPTHPDFVSAAATPAALVAWVKARWAPTNEVFATASSTGGPVGAVDFGTTTNPLDAFELGETGPYDVNAPGFDAADYRTPDLGPDPMRSLRLSSSPLASLARPSIGLAVHPRSDDVTAFWRSGWGSTQGINIGSFYQYDPAGFPLSVIDGAATSLVPITFGGYQPDAINPTFSDVTDAGWPIPPTTRIQGIPTPYPSTEIGDGDRHIIVLDRATGNVYEAYQCAKDAVGDGWTISNGFVYNLLTGDWAPNVTDPDDPRYVPSGQHRFPATLVNAATLPMLPLMATYNKLYVHGRIRHKLGCTFRNEKIGGTAVWPALGTAYSNVGRLNQWGLTIPYGATLRLKADWYRANVQDFTVGTDADGQPEISHVGPPIGTWGEGARVLLRCFLEYGIVNADGGDQGAPWCVADARFVTEDRIGPDIQGVHGLPLAHFEMVAHDDEILRYEVTPDLAATGTQRAIRVYCDYWTKFPQAHPGGDGAFQYRVRLRDPATGSFLVAAAPGEPGVIDGDSVLLTPDRPFANFVLTPSATQDNYRVYPYSDPLGLPWDYFDGTWGVWTTEVNAPLTIDIPTPLVFAPGETRTIPYTITGIGTAQQGTYWATTLGAIELLTPAFTAPAEVGEGEITATLAADQTVSVTVPFAVTLDGTLPDPPPVGGGRGRGRRRRRAMLLRGRNGL